MELDDWVASKCGYGCGTLLHGNVVVGTVVPVSPASQWHVLSLTTIRYRETFESVGIHPGSLRVRGADAPLAPLPPPSPPTSRTSLCREREVDVPSPSLNSALLFDGITVDSVNRRLC